MRTATATNAKAPPDATPNETAAVPGAVTVGARFALQRVLGVGAQATVWLAHDLHLQRDVAVKLLHPDADFGRDTTDAWLAEARSVSRLAHPHIVPVFDAVLHAGQPALVYEYVPGPTLTQQLRRRGALSAAEAVALMLGVLDALAVAHAAGIVHRDLKPSNILLGDDGRARVMDFGIAARVQDAAERGEIVGTPGYISPEGAAGAVPTPAMDVYAAALVLVELLSGHRLLAERDPHRALQRIRTEDLQLPDGLPPDVDDGLRAVLRRAIERDPARRWTSAAALRGALHAWLAPVPVPAADPEFSVHRNATVEFLLRRMRRKSDFPALSASVVGIQRVADSDSASVALLATEILRDVALTNKLLRVVNTAEYAHMGGEIGTVSRAVAVLGFQTVRNMALSLVLLDHMHDKAHARQLEDVFLRALLAGMIAAEIGADVQGGEEAFLGAMFQNLGRLLAEYYFPEEAAQVRAVMAASLLAGPAGRGDDSGEAAAAVEVLGLSYDALGIGIARAWGLPPSLLACMRHPDGEPPQHSAVVAADAGNDAAVRARLRWLTGTANRLTDAVLRGESAQATVRVAEVARRHAGAIGISAAAIEAGTAAARARLGQVAGAMNIVVRPRSVAARLVGAVGGAVGGAAVGATVAASGATASGAPCPATAASGAASLLEPHTLTATRTERHAPRGTAGHGGGSGRDVRPGGAARLLAAGIHDISNSMVEEHGVNGLLQTVVETIHRALGLRRIVLCLRDAKLGALTGRFGLGEGGADTAALFRVPLQPGADLFSAVCAKGVDTLLADATPPHIVARLPEWYRRKVAAPAILLLPLQLKGQPLGLIYGDKDTPGGIALNDEELALLRTLRNQAVMAFRYA